MNALKSVASSDDVSELNHLAFRSLRQHLQSRIIGQPHLVDSLLVDKTAR